MMLQMQMSVHGYPGLKGEGQLQAARHLPSCGMRRMAETAAELVDNLLPRVPERQWALSFPMPLRSLFAVHPELLPPLLHIIHRVINTRGQTNRHQTQRRRVFASDTCGSNCEEMPLCPTAQTASLCFISLYQVILSVTRGVFAYLKRGFAFFCNYSNEWRMK